mmetsp:Transcript_2729/g.4782  ORF Transcript_2729/g.4782 Transcript_2729/m.4782 type:complete len:124 (-) Transcript_2729:685-1056(-)
MYCTWSVEFALEAAIRLFQRNKKDNPKCYASHSFIRWYYFSHIKKIMILFLAAALLSHLTLMLKEQLAIVLPSAKKSQLTTAPLNPKQAKAPRIKPQGNASIRMAPTLALSSSGGRRRSHFSS